MPVEVIEAQRSDPTVVLLCEHASNALPPAWEWPDEDRWIVGTHWAYDLGAAALCRELASMCHAPAVMARFSRLLCDPNRAPHDAAFIRATAEGRKIVLNDDVTDRPEREACWRTYHQAVDRCVAASSAPVLLSVHSFTDSYEGQRRDVELGVLFDEEEELAMRWVEHLGSLGRDVRPNEPYSGRNDLIYSVHRHARSHRRKAIEIEVRQDLCTDPAFREVLVRTLSELV